MRILLGFRHAQIAKVHVREDLRQDVFELFRAKQVAQPGKTLVVLRHAHEEKILGPRRIGEFVEAGFGNRAGHLARAIGAEIEENHGIVVANAPTGGAPRFAARGNHRWARRIRR